MNKLKVLELFGGIGACSRALDHLKIEYEIVDYVEIDKYAVKSYNAIHNTNFQPQDIKEWDKDIEVDLIMHGSPCQDFSTAGKNKGGDEGSGTRSSLMYETVRIIEKLKPKYVIWENVKNLISEKHKHNFSKYLRKLEALGYVSNYKVLNSKDYGIPQNRERIFTISIRNDIKWEFNFPKKEKLTLRLKDLLEENVNEKYFLNDRQVNNIQKSTFNQNQSRIQDEDLCDTLCARDYKDPKCIRLKNLRETIENTDLSKIKETSFIDGYDRKIREDGNAGTIDTGVDFRNTKFLLIKNATNKGYLEAHEGDGIDISSRMATHRGTVQKDMAQTINTQQDGGVVVNLKRGYDIELKKEEEKEQDTIDYLGSYAKGGNGQVSVVGKNGIAPTFTENHGEVMAIPNTDLRIRKLTPKECWRLMGFDDEAFEKASKVNSNAQLYKQAGNSIVVNVLEAIINNLLITEVKDIQLNIFDLMDQV